ncbi:MAG: zinc ribbon domain-containing protein [Pseudomonadota bacterium]
MNSNDKGTFQMLWDCPACDTKKLLGLDHRYCPSCGAPQDASKRYFPKEGEEIAVADHVYHGADWQCPGCDTPNSAKAAFCASCGSPKEGDAKEVGKKQDGPPPKPVAPPAPPRKKSKKGCLLAGCGGALVLGLLAVLAVVLLWKKPVDLVVTGHTWERTIEIERFQALSASEWCDGMPSDAYDVSRKREQRSTKDVADGQECTTRREDQGDGSFKKVEDCHTKYRKEPVYDDKCTYHVDRWQRERTAKATGSSLAEAPSWPSVGQLRKGTSLGAEREGKRSESYTVAYKDGEGDTHTCTWPQATWQGIPDGSRWAAEVGMVLSNLDCGSLKKK